MGAVDVRDPFHERKRNLGFIFAGAINATLANDDEDFGGCCRINCGPCFALDWYRQNANGFVDECLKLAYPESNWDWQKDGKMNWPLLQAKWATHKGCSFGPEEGWRCEW